MLPARTAGAIDIDLEILVLDADVDLVRFGQDGNGCGGSVDAPADSVTGTRCTRWTPLSNFSLAKTPLPVTLATTSL
jgi:hypothetical protein